MKVINYLLWIPLLALAACQQKPIEEYQIIPEPAQVTYVSGTYQLPTAPTIVFASELQNEAVALQNSLAENFSIQAILTSEEKDGDIILKLDNEAGNGNEEGYTLTADTKQITIAGPSAAGVFYGIQTLRQIIQQKDNRAEVQQATIVDYPRFGWRAFMLDEGRHFKGEEVVKNMLNQMASLKMNVFHWHLTEDQGWRIEIKKYPKLTEVGAYRDSTEIDHFNSNVFDGKPHGGYYTQEQIKEIVKYAADRHIQIVPEVEMPGHASAAIAAYPWLGTSGKPIKVACKFGVHYDVYNVADPKVVGFLKDVMEEVLALFPSPVVHIGGDEVRYNQWNESPQVKAYMKEHNLKTASDLQIYFTNEMSNWLASKGRRMMGWNEITGAKLHEYQPEDETEGDEQLAKNSVVQFWKGDSTLIRQTVAKGYDIVNSYHIFTYLDYTYDEIPLTKAYEFDPVLDDLTPEQAAHVLGSGCQMWGEFIPTVESMNLKIYPRLAAYAEVDWTQKDKKDYTRFRSNLNKWIDNWAAQGIVCGDFETEHK